MNNKMNAPIPIPGIQFVAGFENKGVEVGISVIVLVSEGIVAVGVAVKVDVDVNVTVAVCVGVEVYVAVGGIGVLVRRCSSFSGSDVGGQGITPPDGSKQTACAFAFMNGINKIAMSTPINRKKCILIRDVMLPLHLDISSSLILQNVMDQIAHRSAHRYGLSCLRLAIHLSPHHKSQPMLLRNFFCFCLPCQ